MRIVLGGLRDGESLSLAPQPGVAQLEQLAAVRHAARATRLDGGVAGDADRVRVTVTDDGVASMNGRSTTGYGLVGMAERAALLGGSLDAGPDSERGWRVQAVLPKVATTR